MLENYSLADLFYNVYKNIKKNILIAIVIFIFTFTMFVVKATEPKILEVVSDANYSTYISYAVESDKAHNNEDGEYVEPYSSFFYNLLYSNMNGAYLFENVDDETIKKISDELVIDNVQLKKSDSNYWNGKITVISSPENGSVNINILTESLEFNKLVSKKMDQLIEEAEKNLDNVNVKKISDFSATVQESEKEEDLMVERSIDKPMLIKGFFIASIFAVIVVLFVNFIMYVFNPTMNDASAFEKYKIDFVYDYSGLSDLKEVLKYFENKNIDVTLMTTLYESMESTDKNQGSSIMDKVGDVNNIKSLLASDNIIFIEKYGVTRYKEFEKALRQVNNFNKTLVGVINISL